MGRAFCSHLTSIHIFPAVIRKKNIFLQKKFHPSTSEVYKFDSQYVIRGGIRVELGWNYMKFHPNSTPNSTSCNSLIIRAVTILRWKGGITNDKIYFSGNKVGKVLTTVKLVHFI